MQARSCEAFVSPTIIFSVPICSFTGSAGKPVKDMNSENVKAVINTPPIIEFTGEYKYIGLFLVINSSNSLINALRKIEVIAIANDDLKQAYSAEVKTCVLKYIAIKKIMLQVKKQNKNKFANLSASRFVMSS